MNPSKQGFTLIEVLVAITILVGAFSAIFPLLHQSYFQNDRAAQTIEDSMIKENLLTLLSTENPSVNQAGAGQLAGGVLYKWQATPISDELSIRGDELNPRRLRLYQVSVNYERQGRAYQFSFDQMGWYDR